MKIRHLLSATALAALIAQPSFAATTAGTQVNNTATLTYSVGSQAQTPVISAVEFKVDRLVTFTLTGPAPVLNASIGTLGATLTSSVQLQNTSNAEVKFLLSAVSQGIVIPATATSDNTPTGTGVETVVIKNGGAILGPTDVITLAPNLGVALIIEVTPNIGVNNSIFTQEIVATAVDGTAGSYTTITADTGAWIAGTEQTLLDPTLGATRNAFTAVKITGAELVMTKSVVVTDDNNTSTTSTGNEKSVPGAKIKYTIAIQNTGTSIANDVIVKDLVDTAELELALTGTAVTAVTISTSPSSVIDCSTPSACSTVSTTGTASTITFPDVDIPSGETTTITYEATIK